MFTAIKVGTTAVKVGMLAANTSKVLKALQNDVQLWEIQINYYSDFYTSVREKIPPSLYQLALARTRVAVAYVEQLKEKIKKAQVGTKKTQMKLIAKASGEIGATFLQDVEVFFANLEESYQLCLNHITVHQVSKIDLILSKLQEIGNPVTGVKEETQYIGNALSAVVQSRRLIFILESPTKVATGAKAKIEWTTAGAIPHVNIALQVSSIMQQAQDRAKKTYVTIAENVKTNADGIGHYEWEVPSDFVKQHGKHGNYCFKLSYTPHHAHSTEEEKSGEAKKQDFIGTSLVGKTVAFETKVKATSATFKLHDATSASTKKHEGEEKPEKSEKSAEVKVSVTSKATAPVSSALGKATNFMKRK